MEEGLPESDVSGDVPEGFRTACQQSNTYSSCATIGLNLPPDIAVEFFYFGATHGDAQSQFCLGYYYLIGNGIPQSTAKATYWLERALQQNRMTLDKYIMFLYFSRNPLIEGELENRRLTASARLVIEQCMQMRELGVLSSLAEEFIVLYRGKLAAFYSLGVVPQHVVYLEEYKRDLELFNVETASLYLETLAVEESFNARYESALKIAMYLFSRGALTDETSKKLTLALRHIPADNLYYANAQWILSHLCLVAHKKILAQYHFNNFARGEVLSQTTTPLDDATVTGCEAELTAEQEYAIAEMNLSKDHFKHWLETKFQELEPRELNLSQVEAKMFYEYCFRLAQIYSKDNPQIIDYYLDRIPCDHQRFRDAQKMLQHCPAHTQTGRHLTTFYIDIRNNNNDMSTLETRERETYSHHSSKGRKP